MKKQILFTTLLLSSSLAFCQPSSPRLSYAIGVELTKPLIKENMPIDRDAFLQGIYDALSGEPLKMSAEEIHLEITTYMEDLSQRRDKELRMIAENNKKEGEAYLQAFQKEKGTITLPSGIQYKVLASAGLSKHPGPKDIVKTHYKGTLINGQQFDSSYDRGEPVEFSLEQVIPGWTEVLQLMAPGDKWQVVIPSDLAFGSQSPSSLIGPDRTLIFDIELLEYKNAKA